MSRSAAGRACRGPIPPASASGCRTGLAGGGARCGGFMGTDQRLDMGGLGHGVGLPLLAGLLGVCAGAMREPTGQRINSIRKAVVALRQSGGNTGNSIMLSNIADAFLMAGDLTGAEGTLQNGFAFVEQSGERYWLADLHRLNGHVALRKNLDRKRAEACFVKAIEIAKSQDARLLELRAVIDLARLRHDIMSNDDIRGLVAPVLARIEGGETTRDVRDARALLAELD